MKRIPLYRRDGTIRAYALVDAEDFLRFSGSRWYVGVGYARRNEGRTAIFLHREILGLPPGGGRSLQADHINGDPLDNRRANLRVATAAQNMQNRGATYKARSRFRGVEWDAERTCWRVRPQLDGRKHHVGRYPTELEAARAAELWRRQHMPFAQPDPALREAA